MRIAPSLLLLLVAVSLLRGQQPAEPECANAIPCPVEEISSALEGVVNGGISPHRQIRWR